MLSARQPAGDLFNNLRAAASLAMPRRAQAFSRARAQRKDNCDLSPSGAQLHETESGAGPMDRQTVVADLWIAK
jgi:hypothetical protein